MPILLSINKNYFHYSNISNHLLYSIASTLSSLLLKTCSTTQNAIFQKATLAYFKKKQYLCCRFESIRLRLVLSTIGLYIQNRRLYVLLLVLEIRSFK